MKGLKWRSIVPLTIILVGGLGYVLLVERHQQSTSDRELRENEVLKDFVREELSSIEIVSAEKVLRLERSGSGNAPELDPDWYIAKPINVPADPERVRQLLSELEWMEALRSLKQVNAEQLSSFGLTKPRLKVRYTVSGKLVEFSVGKTEPRGKGVYLRVGTSKEVHVVPQTLYQVLIRDVSAYKRKLTPDAGISEEPVP